MGKIATNADRLLLGLDHQQAYGVRFNAQAKVLGSFILVERFTQPPWSSA
jgi:hypothetical protein